MKKNTFKRVLAGSLALLTVAAYMPANVGGLIQTSLVANADATDPATKEETVSFNFNQAKDYITSLKIGNETYTGLTIFNNSIANLPGNTAIALDSKVPLTFSEKRDLIEKDDFKDKRKLVVSGVEAKTTEKAYAALVVKNGTVTYEESDNAFDETDKTVYVVKNNGSTTHNVYLYNDVYYVEGYTIPESDDFKHEKVKPLSDFAAQIKKDTGVTIEEAKLKTALQSTTSLANGKLTLDFASEDLALKPAYNSESTVTPMTVPTISAEGYIDVLLVDATKYHDFANEKFNVTNASSSSTPASTVMTEMLKAANYPTDVTFTSGSKFVVDTTTGFTYLLVKFNPKETVNNNGTYTYNFTVPNIATQAGTTDDYTITANVINETANVRLFKSEADRKATTPLISTTDNAETGATKFNIKWENLSFVRAEDTAKANLVNSTDTNGNIDTASDITNAFDTKDLIVGSTIKVTNDEPFAIYIDNGNTNTALDAPDVTYTDGKFVAEFVMPKYAGAAGGNVDISLVELTETYTYKKSADLSTLTASGKYVTNAEAASIKVKSYDANSTGDYFPTTGTDKGTDVDSTAVEYGKDIVVKLAAGDKFINTNTSDLTIVVKKDDVELKNPNYVTGYTLSSTDFGKNGYALLKLDDAKSGTYKVTFKVKTKGTTATDTETYTLEKTFTVDARGNITTDNITLQFRVFKDNAQIKQLSELQNIIGDAANIKTSGTETAGKYEDAWYEVKCATGKTAEIMLTKNAKELMKNSNYQFKVSAAVTDKDGVALRATTTEAGKAQFEIEGNTLGSKNKDYEVSIRILDPEYGGSETADTIDIPWKVVDYDSKPSFTNNYTTPVTVAQDDAASLGEEILAAVAENDAARALTVDDVSFEYVAGLNGADRTEGEDELDSFESGLPTEKGDYTVYLSYGDEVQSTVSVSITSYKLTVVPDASALSFTYGKDFAVDKYTLKDADGKTVKNVTVSDLSVQFMQPIYKEENGKAVQTGKYEAYGTGYGTDSYNINCYLSEVAKKFNYNISDTTLLPEKQGNQNGLITVDKKDTTDTDRVTGITSLVVPVENVPKLEAGVYYVKFSGKTSDEDYALDTSTVYEVTVSKKKLSDSTINILINPEQYTGKSLTPDETSITALDTETEYDFTKDDPTSTATSPKDKIKQLKLTESFSASKVGEYDVEVGLVDTNTRNYEGTATAKWHVVNKESTINTMNLKWNEAKTTLFDNGRIHVEVTKKDISKLNLGDGVTIEKYGVIVEKEGKIPAPVALMNNPTATYNNLTSDEKTNAEKQLQLNNGFIEGKYTQDNINVVDEKTGKVIEVRNAESVTYSANIKVIDAETGIWARPYVLLSDGTVAYGDAKYLNLEKEAQDKLNLTMPYAKANDVFRVSNMTDAQKKDAKNYVNAGYDVLLNKYYAYATFTDLSNEGFRDTVLEVSDFGVVVDKYGIIKSDAAPADVAKNLRIGKNSKLIVGHYQKGNKNLQGDNEYTANITPANSATGVWVRPYLDLGGGLIVYGDAQYFASASDYFNNFATDQVQSINGIGTLNVSPVADSPKATVKFAPNAQLKTVQERVTAAYVASVTGNKAKDAPTVTIKQVGVVLDKKGLLTADKKWDDTAVTAALSDKYNKVEYATTAAANVYPTANANLILGKGFIEGKKTSNFTVDYTGKVSPVSNDLVVRNYVIYAIGDTELTVYGNPMAYKYDAASKVWDVNAEAKV